jgi:catechol 2,3-dioxygenase-like lactoylglutathione lyase family enzyme
MSTQRFQPDRRGFLGAASTTGALFATHVGAAAEEKQPGPGGDGGPRLRGLGLLSSAPLAKMKEFYQQALGLRVVEERPERLTVAAGQTRLTFLQAAPDGGKPFYHFAFNIPENKLLAARRWQQERTPLLPIPATLRDPKYPDDVVHYSQWNAHSIFFFDPAGNVVEYIARHDLGNAARGDFGSGDILYASEMAFVVDDVPAAVRRLTDVVGAGQYKRASDQFAAVVDEHGLLLVMKRGRVISFDAPEKKAVRVFPTTAVVRGGRRTKYVPPEFPYEITVEG